jgi:hypothetical protein
VRSASSAATRFGLFGVTTMQRYASIFAALWTLTCGPGWLAGAEAHSWYPKECCDDVDCAPVDAVSQLASANGLPQMIVTSVHGRALVPPNHPVRDSKDARMHVCMRPDPNGIMDVMCLFLPPQM